MHIGLFFGSFNPVHTGHLIIGNQALNETNVDKIWFVVSPQNPFKSIDSLLDEEARLKLVREAISGDERFAVCDIEFHLTRPSYTIHTLSCLHEVYPAHKFSIIMGSDSFNELDQWKEFEKIISDHEIIVYRRPGDEIDNKLAATIKVLNAPLLEISSTEIRMLIQNGKSVRYLVPQKVLELIEKNQYYKK